MLVFFIAKDVKQTYTHVGILLETWQNSLELQYFKAMNTSQGLLTAEK